MKVQIVAVDRDGAKVLINKSDYDPERDVLWGAKREPEPLVESSGEYKDRLIAELAERGIKKDRRSSVATLKRLLES